MKTPIPVRLDFEGMVWDYCGLEAEAITAALRAAEQRGIERAIAECDKIYNLSVAKNGDYYNAMAGGASQCGIACRALAQGGEK